MNKLHISKFEGVNVEQIVDHQIEGVNVEQIAN
jgi:hypothetical protein